MLLDYFLVGQTYYAFHARVLDAKKHSGYRRRIFQDSQDCQGCYDFRKSSRSSSRATGNLSIYYPDNSDDLEISVLFKDEGNAASFLGRMANYKGSDQFRGGGIVFERDFECFKSDEKATYILVTDYVKEHSASPNNSRTDTISVSEIPFTGDPLHALCSLEDLTQLPKGDTVFKCHIAPQAFFKEYKHDSNNIIFGSHIFHRYLDGDGRRLPKDKGVPPELCLNFLSSGEKEFCSGVEYVRIDLEVEFRDPERARVMEGRWRDGTKILGELKFKCFFYSKDASRVKKYIDIKRKETLQRWELEDNPDSLLVDEVEEELYEQPANDQETKDDEMET